MSSLLILLLLTQSEDPRSSQGAHAPLVPDESVAKVAREAGLDVATIVPKISPEDIWQTAPYCGVNCLYVFLRLNDLKVTQAELKKEVPTTLNGASMLDLQNAARHFGLETEVVAANPGELKSLRFPMIALLGASANRQVVGHYVVLCNEIAQSIAAVDGTTGNLDRISKAIFNRDFSGYVLVKKRSAIVEVGRYEPTDVALLLGCLLNLGAIAAIQLLPPSSRRIH